jgi:hypothetical protein
MLILYPLPKASLYLSLPNFTYAEVWDGGLTLYFRRSAPGSGAHATISQ